ncbi:nuclear transport factor 2 family protein [Rhizorhabdus wittichii]|uniref:nuclear transport factor 2 family protein n=1 Tax=Rhizorhabdus wittichii TaxID=160791 RepID=UPI00038199A9|nr:nuclear transport factor 2 family protein [Rhizorhabdus wittichii]
MELSERVKRLEDRVELNDLVVSYFLAADGDDLEGVSNSFTETATFSASGIVTGEGRQGIVDFIRASREHMGLTIHTPHYAQFTFDGADHASGLIGAHLELVLGGTAIYGAVRYVDRYIRDADQWRIQARDMRTVHIAPWLEVGEAFESDTPVRWPGTQASSSDFPRKIR